jgi:hypothetical protein
VSSNPIRGKVYSIQHYAIKFSSDLRQANGFLQFPPPKEMFALLIWYTNNNLLVVHVEQVIRNVLVNFILYNVFCLFVVGAYGVVLKCRHKVGFFWSCDIHCNMYTSTGFSTCQKVHHVTKKIQNHTPMKV